MHLTIISGAARPQAASNTAKIIASFCEGYLLGDNTVETWYLSNRAQWDGARSAFRDNTDILFAAPLYVENVPGIMLEFLQSLPPKKNSGTRIFFLLQGGFPEASQGRCCEDFLRTLQGQLGCEYGGTFIRGDMFGVGLVGEKLGRKMVAPFIDVGRLFASRGCFDVEAFAQLASPEYLSEKQIRWFEGMGRHAQKWFMNRIARRLGCRGKLDARPYDETVRNESL